MQMANTTLLNGSIFPLHIYPWHLKYAGFIEKARDIFILQDWEIDIQNKKLVWKDKLFFGYIRYIHQLQNLVFIISGIELDFKEMNEG